MLMFLVLDPFIIIWVLLARPFRTLTGGSVPLVILSRDGVTTGLLLADSVQELRLATTLLHTFSINTNQAASSPRGCLLFSWQGFLRVSISIVVGSASFEPGKGAGVPLRSWIRMVSHGSPLV